MHISDCCQFSGIHISQGSVPIYLRCGGIVKYEFVANLPVSQPVKEFWKSVNIWGSYGQEFSVLFFLRHSVHVTDQGKSNWRFETYDVNKAYHHSSCSCHEIRLNILLPRLYQRHDDVKWKMTAKHWSIWRHLNLFKTHYNNCQCQYFYYAINIRNISNSQVCLLLNLLTWKYSLCTIHLYRESEIVS